MENPGNNIFQNADINLNNSQNNEEEEDLEEQKRRNEELQNLLIEKLDDFNFDESTIQSSTNVSAVSLDESQKNYQQAVEPNEQLKILYDVRLRELNSLKSEFDTYKINKSQEIDSLKKKLFLFEADIQQLRVSCKNSEELLVEKEDELKNTKKELKSKEDQIKNYEITIENLQVDINTYQTAISELQLKLQAGPLFNAKKQFNSEELQKVHQEQIIKLENLLEQQTKTAQILGKEKCILEEEIEKLIAIEKEDQNIIKILTQNFDSAQKQCEELIKVIEDLSIENRHLKDRLNTSYVERNDTSLNIKSNDTVEKLKKMLVDKSTEINVLNAKMKNYEDNSRELIEYRQLKSDVYKKDFQQCDNKEHIKSLLLMQNDLQNYRRIIDDKNQQILTLNSNNKDLLEKMEDMLSQTRNDIQNFSHKYNLPQLEKMAEDLKKAEEKIVVLESQLEKSENKRHSLAQKLQKESRQSPDKEVKKEYECLLNNAKLQFEKEKINFDNQLQQLKQEVDTSLLQMQNMKLQIEQLEKENSELKVYLKNDGENSVKVKVDKNEPDIKQQYLEVSRLLKDATNKIKSLEDNIQELNKIKEMAEEEKTSYQFQLKDCESQMGDLCQSLKSLESEVSQLSKKIEEKDSLISTLMQNARESETLEKEVLYKDNALEMLENNKRELVELLEKTNSELEESKKEILKLQQCLLEVSEKNVRRNLQNELKEAELISEKNRREENVEAVESLKMELNIREEIQKEYLNKIKEIETNYQKAYISSQNSYKELAENLKVQENRHRQQLVEVLKEWAQKIKPLQDERNELLERINIMQHNFEQYKAQVTVNEESYKKMIKNAHLSAQKNVEEWKKWSKKSISSCLKIENINKHFRENLFHTMNHYDKEVSAIERSHNDKIRKYIKSCR